MVGVFHLDVNAVRSLIVISPPIAVLCVSRMSDTNGNSKARAPKSW